MLPYLHACGSTQALLDHRWSRLSSGHLASLELSYADRYVAAISVHVQATAQDCAVCLLLQSLTPRIVCVTIPSSDSC